MISSGDANIRRIIGFEAQILRLPGYVDAALLKVVFNDIPLIFAGKYRESPGPFRVEIG